MNSFDCLIEEAKKLETTEEQVKFIYTYILNNVKYNYAALFKSVLYEHQDEMIDNYGEIECERTDYSYKSKIMDYLELEIKNLIQKHFGNDQILDDEIKLLLSKITFVHEDDSLIKLLGSTSTLINPPIYVDGALVRGDSFNIVDFMSEYFDKLNIQHLRLSGHSTSAPHEWLLVFDDGKPYHTDPTSALFVRDNVFHVNGRQVDYCRMKNSDLFALDPERTIKYVGTRVLDEPITRYNYEQPYDENRVNRNK